MRIYKGSETTLKLPIHVCGVDDVNIDRVILYTTDANKAVIVNNVYVSGETLNVRVESITFDLMEDGVINYIAEGGTTHIEKQSSYYLKTPKDYVAISLETQGKDVTVTKNNSTTVIKPDEGYVGLDEVKVTVNIPTQQGYERVTDNGYYILVPDEGHLFDRADVEVDIPLEYGKEIYATVNNTVVEIEPSEGYKGVTQGKVYVEIPTQEGYRAISDNGNYILVPKEGYLFDKAVINVNIPIQEEKDVNIVKNGTTEVLPDEGYNYIKKVNINTDVTFDSVPILPNGICLSGSTWETFDVTPYDWSKVRSFSKMFQECKNLTSIDLSSFDTSKVTDMSSMFYNCTNLTSLDLSNWDTNKVTSMSYMFYNCYNLTSLDLSNWDTNKVTSMSYMFYNCTNLTSLDLSNWDTSNVTNMNSMFQLCTNLTSIDLSNWDTNKVTNMSYMFYNCNNLTSIDLSSFDTNKVTNMSYMFQECKNLTSIDLSNFDTSKVTNMNSMFYNCINIKEIKMGGDVSKVTNVSSMFGSIKTTGTFYYNPQYDYSKIIAKLPSTWTAVPME